MNLESSNATKIDRSNLASVILLNLGTLCWFFIFIFNMTDVFINLTLNSEEYANYVGNTIVYGSAIIWSIVISFIRYKIDRQKLLLTSTILGIFSTLLLALITGPLLTSIVASLMGMSLGLFLPTSMALVADTTRAENRGRISGIIILSTFVVAFVFLAVYQKLGLDLVSLILIMVIVRSISLFYLLLGKFDINSTISSLEIRIHSDTVKEFIFYLIPWVMFTFASSLANNIIDAEGYATFQDSVQYLRYIFIAIFGLAAGFVADRFGRKQPIIFGLATMGIGYLLISFAIDNTIVLMYNVLSGITWGLFFVVFLVVPGDIAPHSYREKFYSLGYLLPVSVLFALSAIPVVNLKQIVDISILTQIVGGCLFLAMYPVFRAKETLSESKINERKMKEHMERVRKFVQEEEQPHD